MRVRAQMSMMFHLDKCIGCHTCSVACKNLWTDRDGAEYMWWNNVETRPGTGYPTGWEDQDHYKGGWKFVKDGKIDLRLQSKPAALANLFFNPVLPQLEDYYDPFTHKYSDLFDAPASDEQPTAIPISLITGDPIAISSGPNWDDDLGGSDYYARNDVSLADLDASVREQMEEIERVVFNYLPRICNHCLNPACVAACPSTAIYKRAEDGIVLVNEDKCRAWRMCVAACPYKKVYYNWSTGKSEKCILCFPRMEVGESPACAHSCVGRIRYMGVMLYDADKIEEASSVPDDQLVAAQLDAILDPNDPDVIAGARDAGIGEDWLDTARRSPVYQFVKVWGIALPLHPEFRTMAMMFYVPPLSPVISTIENELVRLDIPDKPEDTELFDYIDRARLPVEYIANLFSVGNDDVIRQILRKMYAVRIFKRHQSLNNGTVDDATRKLLDSAGLTEESAEAIYLLTTVPTIAERFVLPPYHREMAIEQLNDPLAYKGAVGVGYIEEPRRGW